MAVNAYLMIDGRPGPSASKQNAIDIMSVGFGTSMAWTHDGSGETRPGQTNLSEVMVTKATDKTSPLLFQDCASGNVYDTVDIIYDKAMGDSQQDYFKIHMEKAHLTSWNVAGGGDATTESLSFGFDKIKISYNPEQDGKLQGFIDKGFDGATLKEW